MQSLRKNASPNYVPSPPSPVTFCQTNSQTRRLRRCQNGSLTCRFPRSLNALQKCVRWSSIPGCSLVLSLTPTVSTPRKQTPPPGRKATHKNAARGVSMPMHLLFPVPQKLYPKNWMPPSRNGWRPPKPKTPQKQSWIRVPLF